MKAALWWTKAGTSVRQWFAQTVPRLRPGSLRHAAFIRWTVIASRRCGQPLPELDYTPPDQAGRVARWLSERVSGGRPAALFATPSSAVRVCTAAAELGVDIAGSFLWMGSEPYTEAKAQAIERAGCRGACGYFISELGGPIGLACPGRTAVDECHLADDRIAVIQQARRLANGGVVPALLYTTISPRIPQIAINLESGDYGVLGQSRCGCEFQQAGLSRSLHTIRSYEKLSTEGMHFLGPDLIRLLEQELPRRFGGGPTDYQLIEEEDDVGISRVCLAVDPRLGPLDEARLGEAVLEFLRSRGVAERMMADVWRQASTLRVVRREAEVSGSGKVLSLHVARGPGRAASG